jgi:hypothetical protein
MVAGGGGGAGAVGVNGSPAVLLEMVVQVQLHQ